MKNIGLYSLISKENIIHQDFRPEKILIDENNRAFVSGSGSIYRRDFKEQSIIWMAPEILSSYKNNKENLHVTSESLVFSLGLIILFAINREGFEGKEGKLNSDEIILEEFLTDLESRDLVPDKEFMIILKKMLKYDGLSRISMENLNYWMVNFC